MCIYQDKVLIYSWNSFQSSNAKEILNIIINECFRHELIDINLINIKKTDRDYLSFTRLLRSMPNVLTEIYIYLHIF